jgi:hypothetical protein
MCSPAVGRVAEQGWQAFTGDGTGRIAMVIGGRLVLVVGAILVVGGLASGCQQYGFDIHTNQANQATDDAALTQSISEVRPDSGSGDVNVQVGSTASVHRVLHYHGHRPGSTTTVVNGVLTLNGCGDDCSVDYMVTLPASAKVDGKTSSGDITVSGATSVDVQTGSGALSVAGVSGPANLSSASGDITVDGIAGNATLQTDSGRVQASGLKGKQTAVRDESGNITVSPDVPQNLDLHASSGDIKVTAPNAGYRLNVTTNSGDRQIGIGDDANGQFSITAEAISGDVTIDTQ